MYNINIYVLVYMRELVSVDRTICVMYQYIMSISIFQFTCICILAHVSSLPDMFSFQSHVFSWGPLATAMN